MRPSDPAGVRGATRDAVFERLNAIVYKITAAPDYLRAELFNRQTVEETRAFLRAVVRENAKHRRGCVLILVRRSKPIFQVLPHGVMEYFVDLSETPSCRIALVGDTKELHMSHEYIELIAHQRRLNVRSFRDETTALHWFKDRRQEQDRRQQQDRRQRQDWRLGQDRRQSQDRRWTARRVSPGIQ